MADNSFDWLQGMLVPTTPQPQKAIDTVLSKPSSQQPITSMLQQSTNVGLPVLAPLTPVMGPFRFLLENFVFTLSLCFRCACKFFAL